MCKFSQQIVKANVKSPISKVYKFLNSRSDNISKSRFKSNEINESFEEMCFNEA